MTGEEWTGIPGYMGAYCVSTLGRVRSLDRVVQRGDFAMALRGKVLKVSLGAVGYGIVSLYTTGKVRKEYVHRLVAQAFLGPIPDAFYVHHLNYDKVDNRLENLAVVSPGRNEADAYQSGKKVAARGMRHPSAVLTDAVVRAIRIDHTRGSRTAGGRALARKYGVSKSTIQRALDGRTWAHVV
jgi:hypothetical protein